MKSLSQLLALIILPLILLTASMHSKALDQTLTSPVLDAKEAFKKGNKDLVGIQLADSILLPGIKADKQKSIRKQHRIHILNRYQKLSKNSREGSKENSRALYKFKRYANRYNLTIMKLIKAERIEKKTRYRY